MPTVCPVRVTLSRCGSPATLSAGAGLIARACGSATRAAQTWLSALPAEARARTTGSSRGSQAPPGYNRFAPPGGAGALAHLTGVHYGAVSRAHQHHGVNAEPRPGPAVSPTPRPGRAPLDAVSVPPPRAWIAHACDLRAARFQPRNQIAGALIAPRRRQRSMGPGSVLVE